MSTTLESQSEQIRMRMASLRQHMHVNAQQAFKNTNKLFDWKDYLRQFPKGLVAAGLLTGFVLSPGRKVTPSVRLSKESIDELLAGRESISRGPAGIQPTLISGALRMLTGVAVPGAIPVLLFGVAGMLERFGGVTPEIARLIVGASVLLCGAVTMWFSLRRIGEAAASLQRSQDEMSQNLKWVRDALHRNTE